MAFTYNASNSNPNWTYDASNSPTWTTTETPKDSKSLFADGLEKYYSLFLVCFGTIGNGLSLAVLSRKTFRTSSIGVYLRCLALSDLTALYTGCVYFMAKGLFDYDLRSTSPLSCRFHRWISYTAVDMSSWILVLVTVARLISIVSPLKIVCTKAVAYVAVIITLLVALAINFPMFLFYGRMKTNSIGKRRCSSFKEHKFFIINVWHWIVLIKFAIFPVGILIILNTFLCYRVFRSHDIMNKINSSSNENSDIVRVSKVPRSFSEWRRQRFKKLFSSRRDLRCDMNISNTDITKVVWTEELALSLLDSNGENCRRSKTQSRNISTEDVNTELIAPPQEKEQSKGIYQNKTTVSDPSTCSAKNTLRNNPVVNLLRKTFSSEKYNLRIKKSTHENGTSDNSADEPQVLSTNQDETCAQNTHPSQSLCYDSRNSFYLARDSLQYTKEKRKQSMSKTEMEDSGFHKDDDGLGFFAENNRENNRVVNRNVCNVNLNANLNANPNRTNPIFTISPAVGIESRYQNMTISDSDSGMDVWDDPADPYPCDNNDNSSTDTFKSAMSVKACSMTTKTCAETRDSNSQEHTNTENKDEISILNGNESQYSKSPDRRKSSIDSTTSGVSKINRHEVTKTLTAAIQTLESSVSLNSLTACKTPSPARSLGTPPISGNRKYETGDSPSKNFRPISLLIKNSSPARSNNKLRISPSNVSVGLLTPFRKDSQLTSSRQSLNTSAVYRRNKGKANSRNLTVTLLVINLVFIICNIPIVIFMTSRTYIFSDNRGMDSHIMEIVSNFTMYTNNAINFILYCLTGTRFRVELKAMMKEVGDLVCRRRRRN